MQNDQEQIPCYDHGPSRDLLLCTWLSREIVETCDWLSSDIFFPKALNRQSSFNEVRFTTGAWTGIFPSSMLTTEDMAGLRVGDGLVHNRAKFNIPSASTSE